MGRWDNGAMAGKRAFLSLPFPPFPPSLPPTITHTHAHTRAPHAHPTRSAKRRQEEKLLKQKLDAEKALQKQRLVMQIKQSKEEKEQQRIKDIRAKGQSHEAPG